MHLSAVLFNTCDMCQTSIRGELVKHVLPTTYTGKRISYYHPSCFFILQERKMDANLKKPFFPVQSK